MEFIIYWTVAVKTHQIQTNERSMFYGSERKRKNRYSHFEIFIDTILNKDFWMLKFESFYSRGGYKAFQY